MVRLVNFIQYVSRNFGSIITLEPHRIHPSTMLNSECLLEYGVKFSRVAMFFVQTQLTKVAALDRIGSVVVHDLISDTVIGDKVSMSTR